MNPMNEAWTLLKGKMSNIDLIARESKSIQEAMASMKESHPDMDDDTAMNLLMQASKAHSLEQDRPPDNYMGLLGDAPEFANVDSSEQDMMRLMPNTNLVHQSGNLPKRDDE